MQNLTLRIGVPAIHMNRPADGDVDTLERSPRWAISGRRKAVIKTADQDWAYKCQVIITL